jgi:hypothetical protein
MKTTAPQLEFEIANPLYNAVHDRIALEQVLSRGLRRCVVPSHGFFVEGGRGGWLFS